MHPTCIVQQLLSLGIQSASVCLGRAHCRRQRGLSASVRELVQPSSRLRLTDMVRIKLPLEVNLLFIPLESTILFSPHLVVPIQFRPRCELSLGSIFLRMLNLPEGRCFQHPETRTRMHSRDPSSSDLGPSSSGLMEGWKTPVS